MRSTIHPAHMYPYNIQQLFFRTFSCSVPAIALKSIAEIRERGVYAVGDDEDQTRMLHSNMVDTSLTINKLFAIWSRNYRIEIEKPRDTVDIFNAITLHLQEWTRYLSYGIQISDAPFQDLIELDRFADSIYEHARFEREKRGLAYFEHSLSGLGLNLNPGTIMGGNNILNPLGSGGSGLFFKAREYHTEEREKFTPELERLGGRHSQAMRDFERSSIFDNLPPDTTKR